MKTMKTKDLNQVMSVLYLGLGYGFIYLWSSWTLEWGLTLFTAAYAIAVLGYCYGSGRKPASTEKTDSRLKSRDATVGSAFFWAIICSV